MTVCAKQPRHRARFVRTVTCVSPYISPSACKAKLSKGKVMISDGIKNYNHGFDHSGGAPGRALLRGEKDAEKAGGAGSADRGCQADCHDAHH